MVCTSIPSRACLCLGIQCFPLPLQDPFLYPFRSPASSLFKTITMTTGEFDFDPLFRQGGDETEEPPYHAVSVILWIIFIVLMPILLMNLLVWL